MMMEVSENDDGGDLYRTQSFDYHQKMTIAIVCAVQDGFDCEWGICPNQNFLNFALASI